ncbi:MAG: HIT family protein [Muribaculaceae bacterium]|nr:HIT family protein [Muribaculaceae bacterium]
MTIFSRIIKGELPSYKIAEDDRFFAFLDINPITWGHTLVVPKIEEDYLFDIDDDMLGDMFKFTKRVAAAIKTALPCRKVGMAVLGLEVPHAHIHLVPLKNEGDLDFKKKIENPSPKKMKEVCELIAKSFK